MDGGELQIVVKSNGVLVLNRVNNSLPLASFTKTREGEKLITLVGWYVKKFHPSATVVKVRTNGNANIQRWLEGEPVTHGIRFVAA